MPISELKLAKNDSINLNLVIWSNTYLHKFICAILISKV